MNPYFQWDTSVFGVSHWSSSPRESHPQALTEPYVTVSRHTALPIQPVWSRLIHIVPPIAGWQYYKTGWGIPFAPVPLQNIQRYYGTLRPCASHWYSGTCSCNYLCGSLDIETTGSHVPYKTLLSGHAILYAGCRMGRIQVTPKLITEKARILLLTP